MASTYSSRLRVELQATGENSTTWGTKANAVFQRLEEAIAGYESIAMADGNVTLSSNNGSSDQSRLMLLTFTGAHTAPRTVTIPAVSKIYIVRNSTTGGYPITISNGTNSVSIAASTWAVVWTDGTTVSVGPYMSTSDMKLVSQDAGASAGPNLTLYRDSASPAASDVLGRILFQGEDSAGNTQDYAEIYVTLVDPTSTSEDASLVLRTVVAGTMTTVATFTSTGLDLGSAGRIKFPATQSASSDANTLDDYEESTYTPTVSPANGLLTAYTASGVSTKIGNMVFWDVDISITTAGTASGGMIVTLPDYVPAVAGVAFGSAGGTNHLSGAFAAAATQVQVGGASWSDGTAHRISGHFRV